MTEFLSMTMLSAESVSAAKPQAAQSNDGATEPDQSFAATLAAEVNGKAPEKSGKTSSKTRQNTASAVQENKETTAEQNTLATDSKNDNAKTVSSNGSATGYTEEALPEVVDVALVQGEPAEAAHSHWLNMLEKAKNLQERLTKTDADKAAALTEHTSAQASKAKLQSDEAQLAVNTDAQALASSKAKMSEQKDGAIVLDKKLTSEQSSGQHFTAEELKALAHIAHSDKTTAKNQSVSTEFKALTAEQNAEVETTSETESEDIEKATAQIFDKADVRSKLGMLKDTGPDQNKIMAHIEKPLKMGTEAAQALDSDKVSVAEAEMQLVVTTASKTPVQSEQAVTNLKANMAAFNHSDETRERNENTDNDSLLAHSVAGEPKVSAQAQSAAALVTPLAGQVKGAAAEPKTTTEEVLKQLQSAAAAQGEQGSSSSSGEPSQHSQQGSTDTILAATEQQKTSAPVSTEVGSFSSQLKSNLEKISSAMTVTSREFVSEASQKQADQLGQKLNLIQPEASNQLKEKMLMMVKDKVHTAEIRLDPSELGSMQIKISLQQDQMSVQFMVQQGNAKELMEQQMPKLKELLQQQGIELSQGSVQQQNQSSGGQEGGRRTAAGRASGLGQNTSDELVDTGMIQTKTSDRVVDYYA